MTHCHNCGRYLPDILHRCRYCGTPRPMGPVTKVALAVAAVLIFTIIALLAMQGG